MILGKDKVTPKIVAEAKAILGPEIAIYHYKDKTGRYEAIFKEINHDLMKRIRTRIKEETLKNNLLPMEEINDMVFDECIIWPPVSTEDKNNLPVGKIVDIVKSIQEKSGFLDVDLAERPLRPDIYTEIIQDFDYWPSITKEEIVELKEKIPFQLFKVEIGGFEFVIRPLTKADIFLVNSSQDEQSTACKAVTVWPTKVPWETLSGGVILLLSQEITRVSGFSSDSEVTEL